MAFPLWFDPAVLDWEAHVEGSLVGDGAPARRAYEHLRHAELVLKRGSTALDLVDAVGTLKRAVDHRLRLLNSQYKWKALPVPGLPKSQLQLLEFLGVARHRMVERLISFRNAIEHGDKSPPDRESCIDLAETVWYFLRSTDSLALGIRTDVAIDMPSDQSPQLGITISACASDGWLVKFRSALPPRYFAAVPHDDWIRLRVEWAAIEQLMIPKRPSATADAVVSHIRSGTETLCVNGQIEGPSDLLRRILTVYFSAS